MVDPGVASGGLLVVMVPVVVQLGVTLGVAKIQMSLLNQGRNLLKLFVGVLLMVLHNTAEDFGQVTVEVGGNGTLILRCSVQLQLDFLQRFRTDAHIELPYLI